MFFAAAIAPLKRLIFGVPPEQKLKQRISDAIYVYSAKYDLDPVLVASVVWQESRGNPWAQRFEKKFYLEKILPRSREELAGWVPAVNELPTLDTERVARAHSWGLMQVLLETARVVGYSEPYATELCVVETNIDVGCCYLRVCFERAAREHSRGEIRFGWGIREQALFRYNGGEGYPKVVLGHVESGVYREVLYEPRKPA